MMTPRDGDFRTPLHLSDMDGGDGKKKFLANAHAMPSSSAAAPAAAKAVAASKAAATDVVDSQNQSQKSPSASPCASDNSMKRAEQNEARVRQCAETTFKGTTPRTAERALRKRWGVPDVPLTPSLLLHRFRMRMADFNQFMFLKKLQQHRVTGSFTELLMEVACPPVLVGSQTEAQVKDA